MTTTRTTNKNALQLISDRIAFTGSNFYGVVTPPDRVVHQTGMLPDQVA